MKTLAVVILLFSINTFAQESIGYKSVSECAKDLKTKVWWDGSTKKAEKYCKDYTQETIDCAISLSQAKQISYNFDKAVKDCARKRHDDY